MYVLARALSAGVPTQVRGITQFWSARGLPRLLYALGRMLPDERSLFQVDGDRFLALNPHQYIECMMLFGRYAPEVAAIIRESVRPGDTAIDVGAHVGYFSTQLAGLVAPEGRVYAFEPDPRPRRSLEQAIRTNAMDWVEVLPFVLSDVQSDVDFFVSPTWGWSTMIGCSHHTDLEQTRTRSETLDKLVQADIVKGPINFIKIDTEGSELAVLRGMEDTIQRDRPTLLIECNPKMMRPQGLSPDDLLLWLERRGYQVFLIRPFGHWWVGRHKRAARVHVQAGEEFGFGDLLCSPR